MVGTVDEPQAWAFGSRHKRLKALWHVLAREIRDGLWWVGLRAFEVAGVLMIGNDTDLLGILDRKRI